MTKPRGIPLHSFELAAAREGRLSCVVRPVKRPKWAEGRDIEIDQRGMPCCFDGMQNTEAFLPCPFAKRIAILAPDSTEQNIKIQPHYMTGDVWFGREAWAPFMRKRRDNGQKVCYRHDWPELSKTWKPARSMPAEFARHWFKTESVSVKQLKDVTDSECELAGVVLLQGHDDEHAGMIFRECLKKIYRDITRQTWCWVSTVTRIEREGR